MNSESHAQDARSGRCIAREIAWLQESGTETDEDGTRQRNCDRGDVERQNHFRDRPNHLNWCNIGLVDMQTERDI